MAKPCILVEELCTCLWTWPISSNDLGNSTKSVQARRYCPNAHSLLVIYIFVKILQITDPGEIKMHIHEANARVEIGMC